MPGSADFPIPSIAAVDPDFQPARSWQTHLQVDRSFGDHYSASAGFVHAQHSSLPVTTDVNLANPVARLDDGRPVFSPLVSVLSRTDPRFDHIYVVQSTGEGAYNALTFSMNRRYTRGLGFDLSYTLARAEDNAPLHRSDPTDLDRDRGPALLDIRHNFTGSFVYNPAFDPGSQFGVVLQMRSGIPFDVRTAADLNGDGAANDRPLFIGRNIGRLPRRSNVDLRYSRRITVGTVTGEVIGELTNAFNASQAATVNSVVTGAVPAVFPPIAFQAPRQLQLGVRLRF
jgi:hypothetical protein